MTPLLAWFYHTGVIARTMEGLLRDSLKGYPVLAITGPRQSGKTTLARKVFSDFHYLSMEETDLATMSRTDPRGFFLRFKGSLILDEVQKTPEVLSYIQGIVDEPKNQRRFILTGSEHLLLSDKISQTLAGRVRSFHLLPFSRAEVPQSTLLKSLLFGGYPRIHDRDLSPTEWLSQYYSAYVQRDVRSVLNVGDLNQFDRLVRLAAGRIGQLLDYSSIASDCGISQPTAKAWLSVLQATFICFILEPHFRNFNKRIIKSPKLYFFDTGLLCYLLRIQTEDQLISHPLYGSIFENWVIAEHLKSRFHQGQESNFYFWRDQKGHEIDLISDQGDHLIPIEIKAGATFHPSFLKNLVYLNELQESSISKVDVRGQCIYGGSESFPYKEYEVKAWSDIV